MDRRALIGWVTRGVATPLGASSQQCHALWRAGSLNFTSQQSPQSSSRHDLRSPRTLLTRSKLRQVTRAGLAGIGGLCSPAVSSEERPDDAERPSGRSDAGFALNIFGLSLHTNRTEGHNEINPGVGLRYVFREPAPPWSLFGEASVYYDSNREWSKYIALGTSYRFAKSWMVGAAVAYGQSRSYNDGKPFFALIPGVAFEYRLIVYNAVLLPSGDGSGISGLGFYITIPLSRPE